MRKLQNQFLNDDFFREEIEAEFNIDIEEVRKIVAAPFAYTKNQMEKDTLPTIRLKYFGTFMVHTSRAEAILDRTEQQFAKGTLTPPVYEKRKTFLQALIKSRKETE